MNKLFLLLSAAVFSVTVSARASLVEQYARKLTPPRTYVCLKADKPLNIDGALDEADWQRAPFTDDFVDISGIDYPKPKYRTRAKLLWDDDYLYIGAELEEPNIKALLQQRDTIIYKDNDFEVFIDPEGDCRSYFEIELNARNTVFDLMLDRPYRVGGDFFVQWNCPGMRSAVKCDGTLNQASDRDRSWTVEMAIPRQAIASSFSNPLQRGKWIRLNFSRVEWLKKGGPEENWVWSPTGKVDMHMPERWGYIQLAGPGQSQSFSYPYNQNIYRLMWALYYAQEDYQAQHGQFATELESLGLGAEDRALLPAGSELRLEGSHSIYNIIVNTGTQRYILDSYGYFRIEKKKP